MTLQLLGGLLLVCLGLLLGSAWTTQALQPKLRRLAEERRRLDEEWLAVRTSRWQGDECPRCGSLLSEGEFVCHQRHQMSFPAETAIMMQGTRRADDGHS